MRTTRHAHRLPALLLVGGLVLHSARAQWVAYNDHAPGAGTAARVTSHSLGLSGNAGVAAGGPLTDFSSGITLGAGVAVTSSGYISGVTGGAAAPNPGTPADLLFGGKVDWSASALYFGPAPYTASVTLTFTNLTPGRTYSFRGVPQRGTNYVGRWTLVTLAGASAATPAHQQGSGSPRLITNGWAAFGAGLVPRLQVAVNSGRNLCGDVVGWDQITPVGASFSVICSNYHVLVASGAAVPGGTIEDTYAYALSAFRLEEADGPPTPPTIGSQPLDQRVVVGSNAFFSVGAAGSFPLSYQWYHHGGLLAGATNSAYAVTNATRAAEGEYRVVVTNLYGAATSDVATLTVDYFTISGVVWDDQNGNGEWERLLLQGERPDVVFVIDASCSTRDPFLGADVGDVNRDGISDSILDAELASLIAVNRALLAQGLATNARVAVVIFSDFATNLDMNPVLPGLQWATLPGADANSNGIPDVEEALLSITNTCGTIYGSALRAASETFANLQTAAGNGNVVFVSDGEPIDLGLYGDAAVALRAAGINVRAFGAGSDATLATLRVLDPAARLFTNAPQLIEFFLGFTSGFSVAEPGLPDVLVYLDLDQNGRLDPGEPVTQSAGDDPGTIGTDERGSYRFTHLVAGSYSIRQVPMPGFTATYPGGDGAHHLQVSNRLVCAGYNFGDTRFIGGALAGASALLDLTNSPWRFFTNGFEPAGWRNPAFNDASWPLGRALFGYETTPSIYSPLPMATPIAPDQTGGPLTAYFRAPFVWYGEPGPAVLTMTNYLDDGAAFYLNGAEVASRVRLAAGALSYTNLATNAPEPAKDFLQFTVSNLVSGTNFFAVELHQTATNSTDLVFGLELWGTNSLLFTDHEGRDWAPAHGARIGGTHINVRHFLIATGAAVRVWPGDGVQPGALLVRAQHVQIDGLLDATGSGFAADTGPFAGTNGLHGGYQAPATNGDLTANETVFLGSGGGSLNTASGGSGGGAVWLHALNSLVLAGQVRTAGLPGLTGSDRLTGGAGAGGGLLLKSPVVRVTGDIQAAGGLNTNNGGTVKVFHEAGRVTFQPSGLECGRLLFEPYCPEPVITNAPGDRIACVGTEVEFRVGAFAPGEITFQWQFNGQNLPGQTNAWLSIPAVSFAHAGAYAVLAANDCGSARSRPVSLTVNAPPQITQQPAPATNDLLAGQALTLSAQATSTLPLALQWYRDGAPIAGATSSVWSVSAVTRTEAGRYWLEAANSCGTVTSAVAKVDVTYYSISGVVWDDLNANGQWERRLIKGRNPDVVFVIDASCSTKEPFLGASVGDVNHDGLTNSILDGELAGLVAVNQALLAQGYGTNARVSIVIFSDTATNLDLNPALPGLQLATFPAADADRNGVSDVEDALLHITNTCGTYYGHALQAAYATFTNLHTMPANANMVFVSDGEPNDLGTYGGGAARLQEAGVNLRAFGAGTDATLATLRVIDPAARLFTNGPQLSAYFLGFTNGFAASEPGLAGATVYLDLNGNGRLEAGEPAQQSAFDDPLTEGVAETGAFAFSNLLAGSYTLRHIAPPAYSPTYPGDDRAHHLALAGRATSAGNNFGDTQLGGADRRTLSVLVDLTNSLWRYQTNGLEPAGWQERSFDDRAWPSGRALFGYETTPALYSPLVFQTPITSVQNRGPLTTYFRVPFVWYGASGPTTLFMTNYIDDGAVFYLNGLEVGSRLRLAAGPVSYTNLTTLTSPEPTSDLLSFTVTNLVPGTNLLAVEVHQSATNSSDLVFGLELWGTNTFTLQDHQGQDWILTDGSVIGGSHLNVGRFVIPSGASVFVRGFDGTAYGSLTVQARQIEIAGLLEATGRGFGPDTGPFAGLNGAEGGYQAPAANGDLTLNQSVFLGSGGGSHGGRGGSGGGAVLLFAAEDLTLSGQVRTGGTPGSQDTNGLSGSSGAGGGLLLHAPMVQVTGGLLAPGGLTTKNGGTVKVFHEENGLVFNPPAQLQCGRLLLRQFCRVPVITNAPLGLEVCEGSAALFQVGATAPGQLTYQWARNGLEMPGQTQPTLLIPSASLADVGDYAVFVMNECGEVMSAPVTLQVANPPHFTLQPGPATNDLIGGQSLTLTASVGSTRNPALQWFHNGAPLPGATSSSFSILTASAADAGLYWLRAANACGSVTSAVVAVGVRYLGEISGTVWDDRNGNGLWDQVLIRGQAPDVVFVIDISSSTLEPFVGLPTGDLNGDGSSDSILDAEIAGFITLNQSLIAHGLGTNARVAIVTFFGVATNLDLNPALPGLQLATFPLADEDHDGTNDVEQALRSVRIGLGTYYDLALSAATNTFSQLGTSSTNGNLVFISDGEPNGGPYTNQIAELRRLGIYSRAFGAGSSASLPPLQRLDPDAQIFTRSSQLVTAFGGPTTSIFERELGLPGVTVFLDLNRNGRLDEGEPSGLTAVDNPATWETDETGLYRFTALPPGLYVVGEVPPLGYGVTAPTNGPFHVVTLGTNEIRPALDFGNTLHGLFTVRNTPGSPEPLFTLLRPGGLAHVIETSTNLVNWTTFTNVVTTNAFFQFRAAAWRHDPCRYYRARLLQ